MNNLKVSEYLLLKYLLVIWLYDGTQSINTHKSWHLKKRVISWNEQPACWIIYHWQCSRIGKVLRHWRKMRSPSVKYGQAHVIYKNTYYIWTDYTLVFLLLEYSIFSFFRRRQFPLLPPNFFCISDLGIGCSFISLFMLKLKFTL